MSDKYDVSAIKKDKNRLSLMEYSCCVGSKMIMSYDIDI